MQSEQKPDFHDDLIKELLYWIEVNLSDRLTMEKASKKTGYSPWYLQRLFKSKTGYAASGSNIPLITNERQIKN